MPELEKIASEWSADAAGTTSTTAEYTEPASKSFQLLVLEPRGLTTHALSEAGETSIGRAAEAAVRLADPLASRRHATLSLPALTIRDEGSANGTRIQGQRLPPGVEVPLQLGQAVQIGGAILIVRRNASGTFPAVRVRASSSARAPTEIVVRDPAMQELYALVDRVASGSINVLVLGETGVGKEIVAETVHARSPRGSGPLVRINCAVLGESLLESELFGHERGAFTGAVSAKPGLLEAGDGGSVFLDEVGELSLGLQAKLLRVIETREVRRLGGLRSRAIDVRFVAATNRDLAQAVASGTFRSDLFFRLNGVAVTVPPLRARPSEILPLASEFLLRTARQMQLPRLPLLTDAASAALLAHSWPGNVRELRNVIERSVLLCAEGTITERDLALEASHDARASIEPPSPSTLPPEHPDSGDQPEDFSSGAAEQERQRIADALKACGGNQSRAALSLGMPRRTLVRRIAQLGLPRPRTRSE